MLLYSLTVHLLNPVKGLTKLLMKYASWTKKSVYMYMTRNKLMFPMHAARIVSTYTVHVQYARTHNIYTI